MSGPSEDRHVDTDEQFHALIAKYHRRLDSDGSVDRDSFAAEHPDFSDQLKSYFRDVEQVEFLAGPTASELSKPESAAVEQTVVSGETQDVFHAETMIENSTSADNMRITRDAPPTQFGRYRILNELGRGAMGAVYLALDEQLDRKVALKIPQFGGAMSSDLLERFYREARAAGNLRHNGICPVYDVGEIDGQHYITMAYIEGRPLRDFSKSSRRQEGKQVARVIRKIALAMEVAHKQNVVHRDLKPANVMIDTDNEPVVMDFGLARRATENEEKITHTGTVIGTPAYMSPEQVDGDNDNVGPPADIYSLGVIFYELLTGELPFQGNLMSILKQIALTEPRPPIEIQGDVDPFLQDLCLKMLAKESKDRPESMEQVARELSDWLQGLHAPIDESGVLETSRIPGQSRKEKANALEATDAMTTPGKARTVPQSEEFPSVADSERVTSGEMSATTVTPERPRIAAGPPPEKNRKLLLSGGLGGAALLLAGITFFFTLGGKYDVKITVEDPAISLKVDGDDVLIDGVGSPIRLSAGPHTLRMEREGLEAELEEFTVSRDGNTAVHVTVIDGKLGIANGQRTQTPQSDAMPIASVKGSVDVDSLPAPQTASVSTQANYALEFDGQDDYVFGLGPQVDFSRPFTIEATVQPLGNAIEQPGAANIVGTQLFGLRLWLNRRSWEAGFFGKYLDARTYSQIHTDLIPKTHLAMQSDGSEVQFYVNGRLAGSRKISPVSIKSSPGLAADFSKQVDGTPVESTNHFHGIIDEVRVSSVARYDKVFTPAKRFEPDADTLSLYHFDEGQGDVLKDSSGNDHHGKIVGAKWVRADAVSPSSSDQPENKNPIRTNNNAPETYALEFDGTRSFVEIPKGFDLSVPFAFEAWVACSDFGSYSSKNDQLQSTGHIIRSSERSSGAVSLECRPVNGKMHWAFAMIGKDRSVTSVVSDQPCRIEQLTHLAGSFDGRRISLHVDGKRQGKPVELKPVKTPQQSLLLGASEGNEPTFAGRIGSVRISSSNRTALEFAPEKRFVSDEQTLALYHFDEGQGDVLKDSSGNDHHGKIVGAKWVNASSTGATPSELLPKPTDPAIMQALRAAGDKVRLTFRQPELAKDRVIQGSHALPAQAGTVVGVQILPDEGFDPTEFLESVAQLPDLESLRVSSSDFDHGDLDLVAKLSRLEVLHLDGSSVPNGGERLLQSLPRLRRLHLPHDHSDEWVGAAAKHPSVREIEAFRTTLTDAGLAPLESMHGLTKLVVIQCPKASREAVARLAAQRPDVEVSYNNELLSMSPPRPAIAPFDAAVAKAHQEGWARHLGEPVETTNSIGMKLAVIPPGSFKIGEGDIAADVTLTKPFRIGVHEVTQGQWKAVMGTEPWKDQKDVRENDNIPATFVSWTDATKFCRKLTEQERAAGRLQQDREYRLPAETQWEFACRAGTTTKYVFGDSDSDLSEYAWYDSNTKNAGETYAHEVASKKPNPWGLHDMHGNVSEWCSDWHEDALPGGTDPEGPSDGLGRVYRGGSWNLSSGGCRSAIRGKSAPSSLYDYVGFRVALCPSAAVPPPANAPFKEAQATARQRAAAD